MVLPYNAAVRDGSARGVAFVGASCLLAGWVLGSALRPPVAMTQQAVRARPVEAPLERPDLPSVSEARRKLGLYAEAPDGSRNPFAFGPRAGVARSVPGASPSEPVPRGLGDSAPGEMPSAPAADAAWRLVGVALDDSDAVLLPRAILSNGTDVQLAAPGEQLPDGTTIDEVQDAAVTLRLPSGARVILRLSGLTPGD